LARLGDVDLVFKLKNGAGCTILSQLSCEIKKLERYVFFYPHFYFHF
jgi:hypothetical protein